MFYGACPQAGCCERSQWRRRGIPHPSSTQREAALRHRHSQYAPRTQLQKIVGERRAAKRELETSLTARLITPNANRSANMADSEKLDNQRLKNFKNKGRDLEVKVPPIGVEELLPSATPPLCSRLASPPGFLVTSFLISTGTLLSKPLPGP